jgi:hypothetical protein
MSETSMVGSLGGTDEDPKRPPPMSETLMVSPLGGAIEDPGVPTTYVGDVNGGPPRRR